MEALQLHFLPGPQPELEEANAFPLDQLFELRRLFHEIFILFRRAEAHDRFDAGTVVPGAVEEDEFPRRREVRDVALEVPLAALRLRRLGQGDHPGGARVHVGERCMDRATLARRIAALEQRHDPFAGLLHPELHFDEFDLQLFQFRVVFLLREFLVVGEASGLQGFVFDPVRQVWLVDIENSLLACDRQCHCPAFRLRVHHLPRLLCWVFPT